MGGKRRKERTRNEQPTQRGWNFGLTPEQAAELQAATHFTDKQIAGVLSSRWALVADETGRASYRQVCALPELVPYLLTQRLVAVHNTDKSGSMTFPDYVKVMSQLAGTSSASEKVESAFNLCDCDQRGAIDGIDLFNIFRLHIGQHMSDDTLQQIVDSFYSRYPDGLGISDFAQMLTPMDLAKLTLNV